MYQLSFPVTTPLKTESLKLTTIYLLIILDRLGGFLILASFTDLSVVPMASQLVDLLG